MTSTYSVSCVVIGLNCARTIEQCLQSIERCDYPNIVETIFVDSGSTDQTIDIVSKLRFVRLVRLSDVFPTAGKGRNAGWQSARGELIQFLDGDTVMDPHWISVATQHIEHKIAAVQGHRRELYPSKNYFHRVTNLEWPTRVGDLSEFGGDILIRRDVLAQLQGYGPYKAGEEPELASRIQAAGFRIIGIDHIMTLHDINMNSFKEYWLRCKRAGYAYAECGPIMKLHGNPDWEKKSNKVLIRTLIPVLLIVTAAYYHSWILLGASILGGIYPVIKFFWNKNMKSNNTIPTLEYAIHCGFCVYPQTVGMFHHYYRKLKDSFT